MKSSLRALWYGECDSDNFNSEIGSEKYNCSPYINTNNKFSKYQRRVSKSKK